MVQYYESPEAEDVPDYRENDELGEDDQERNACTPIDSPGTVKAGGFHEVNHAEDKLLRRFSVALISRALESSWDDEEVARLVVLIAQERELSTKKTLKLLRKCSICKPALLARLGDEGLAFTDQQIIGVVYEQCRGVDQFIDTMGDVFEQGLLDFRKGREDEVTTALRDIAEGFMSTQQYRRFAAIVCEHSADKQSCGRVLDALAQNMDASAASYFICDVIRYDFFLDLSGNMKSFYGQLKRREVRRAVENLLSTSRAMDKEGNLVDSDSEADEHGNLKDFVVGDGDDDIVYSESERSFEDSDDGDDDDDNEEDEEDEEVDEDEDTPVAKRGKGERHSHKGGGSSGDGNGSCSRNANRNASKKSHASDSGSGRHVSAASGRVATSKNGVIDITGASPASEKKPRGNTRSSNHSGNTHSHSSNSINNSTSNSAKPVHSNAASEGANTHGNVRKRLHKTNARAVKKRRDSLDDDGILDLTESPEVKVIWSASSLLLSGARKEHQSHTKKVPISSGKIISSSSSSNSHIQGKPSRERAHSGGSASGSDDGEKKSSKKSQQTSNSNRPAGNKRRIVDSDEDDD